MSGQQDISKTVRMIKQKAHGTASGAIIDMAIGICSILDRFNHRLTKLEEQTCCSSEVVGTENPETVGESQDEKLSAESGPTTKSEADSVRICLPGVFDEVLDVPTSETVPEPIVSKPERKATKKADKGKTRKANKK